MMTKLRMTDKLKCWILSLFLLSALFIAEKTGFLTGLFFYSVCRKVYLPVGLWSLVVLYTVFMHLAFFKKGDDMAVNVRHGMVLGFVMNLYIALSGLVISLIKDHSFLSAPYFLYIECVLAVSTLLISVFSVSCIEEARRKGEEGRVHDIFFYLPVTLSPVFFIGFRMNLFSPPVFAALAALYILPYIFLAAGSIGPVAGKLKAGIRFLLKPRVFIIAVFILSFATRFLFGVNIINKTEANGQGMFITASDDGPGYDEHAREMVRDPSAIGTKYKIWGNILDDAYSILLAAIYKIFGRNFYAVTVIQSLIGAVLPVLIFLLGGLLFSKKTGMIAGLAVAIKGPLVMTSAILGHEAIWITVAALFVFLLSLYYKAGNRIALASSGAAFGILCVFRGLYIYLGPLTIIWIILFWRGKALRERVKGVLIFALSALLIMSVVSAVFKSPINLGSKERAVSLWGVKRHIGDEYRTIGNKRLMDIGVNFARDIPGSLKTIAKDPLRFVSVACGIYPRRIFGYLESYQFGYFDPIYLINSANRPNDFMPTLEFYFTLFFLWGLALCLKNLEILRSPVFLIIIFNILIYAIIFYYVAPRYRDASTPFVYLIGAYGLTSIYGYLRDTKIAVR